MYANYTGQLPGTLANNACSAILYVILDTDLYNFPYPI